MRVHLERRPHLGTREEEEERSKGAMSLGPITENVSWQGGELSRRAEAQGGTSQQAGLHVQHLERSSHLAYHRTKKKLFLVLGTYPREARGSMDFAPNFEQLKAPPQSQIRTRIFRCSSIFSYAFSAPAWFEQDTIQMQMRREGQSLSVEAICLLYHMHRCTSLASERECMSDE